MKGMREPTMLYRKGTKERLHGVRVDTVIVDAHEVDDYLEDGWFRTPAEVKQAEGEQDSQEVAIERARQEGIRLAREEEQRRLFEEAVQRAREEGAREERERLAAERGESAEKGAPRKVPAPKESS
ncbi:hypothetical protein [Paraburkholderia caballeronis]|uniref:hypothetical protein n=1 Tax=Paraburkholderia caballeronis TaxID=416943 RepID=UPI001066E012|nr:hypothetical protein [Paraburkholderia caballeronis]TDV06060.1 hypothetical protein C7408_12441 [Paraburkholderia caballeronis]TDV09600.1 hypothetical protein C7406_12641 [Paraburkholderia caballeronis]TDV21665.1 hypothetical protein C7404_12141 [Paraburkholderia caballeronis]